VFRRAVLTAATVLGLSGCSQPVPPPAPPVALEHLTLTPAVFSDLPGWTEDRVVEAWPALLRSCALLSAQPTDKTVGRNGIGGRAGDWRSPCAAAKAVSPLTEAAARRVLETWFQPWRAERTDGRDGLFTGYYETELRGSLRPDARYRFPIYGRPQDLVTVDGRADLSVGRMTDGKLVPYPTRAEIDRGAVDGQAPVLVWAEDPVDVLLLHIQGSGRVKLPDGTVRRVGFAISNGHPFVGIGRTLIDRGKLPRDQASMQAVVAWLRANPGEAAALVQENPRYIFFRTLDGDGPLGAQGIALTPGRSLAVDPEHVPLGMPLWLDTKDPDGKPLRRLMMAQDTGAAIKGPIRGDFFWGAGTGAFDKAGRMKSRGGYWLVLPKRNADVASASDPVHAQGSGLTIALAQP
jgi:membrane-bound lytic murein transglycosylase A